MELEPGRPVFFELSPGSILKPWTAPAAGREAITSEVALPERPGGCQGSHGPGCNRLPYKKAVACRKNLPRDEACCPSLLVDVETMQEIGTLPIDWGGTLLWESADALLTHGFSGLLRWPLNRLPGVPEEVCIGPPERLLPPGSTEGWGASADAKTIARLGIPFDGTRNTVDRLHKSTWHALACSQALGRAATGNAARLRRR
jgi:hypothetical protein